MSEIAMVFYKIVKHNSYCLICGSPNVQFHHCTPAEKINEIHKVAKTGDLAACIDELQKCVPLCDPHHRGVHRGVIQGWLDGHHDNGRPSTAFAAAKFRPYVTWFGRAHPHIIKRFYRDYIDREHQAISAVFNQCGLPFPKTRRLVSLSLEERLPDVPGNNFSPPSQDAHTTRLSLVASNKDHGPA